MNGKSPELFGDDDLIESLQCRAAGNDRNLPWEPLGFVAFL